MANIIPVLLLLSNSLYKGGTIVIFITHLIKPLEGRTSDIKHIAVKEIQETNITGKHTLKNIL